jgi:hypothetical protein
MYEYVAFNPYNSSPEALATELTKKSADGWEVVNIVPTFDGRYCAFLRRPTNPSQLLLQQPGTQIHPSVLSCATGTVPSGQNMLLAVVSNLPINQWPETT